MKNIFEAAKIAKEIRNGNLEDKAFIYLEEIRFVINRIF